MRLADLRPLDLGHCLRECAPCDGEPQVTGRFPDHRELGLDQLRRPAADHLGPEVVELAQRRRVERGRADALRAIREEIGDCQRCPLAPTRNKIVFGDGNPNARLMFVGEGPGADEDAQGLPFVGRGGQLLNDVHGALWSHRPVDQHGLQIAALDQPHIEVETAVDFAVVVDRNHMRAVQSCSRVGFAAKPPLKLLVVREMRR